MDERGMERDGRWSSLLAETRGALARLQVDDLERLAAQAERMLRAGEAGDPSVLEAGKTRGVQLAREHRLLGDLLKATESNCAVLRRLGGGCVAGREGDARWAR